MSSYRHLEAAGIRRGEPLTVDIQRVVPKIASLTRVTENVEGFAGGGFYGSVILLGNMVVKTAQPDAFHDLLRQINWPVPFPSRGSENAAKLDYLSGRIIGGVIPKVTGIAVPRAEGYTHLPDSLGYGQVIERVQGRGPTFLDGGEENQKIREARQKVWRAGVIFGFEAAAQAHPKNPFGKPNIWLNDEGQVTWLDYLPAFRTTGFIKPWFWYRFHKQVRKAFSVEVPTYNRIHTELTYRALEKRQDKFTTNQLDTLDGLIQTYRGVSNEFDKEQAEPARSLFISDELSRGLISKRHSERLKRNDVLYRLHRAKQIGGLATRAAVDFANATPLRMLWSRDPWRNMKKFLTNREYFLESTMLRGMKKARQKGLVGEEEFTRTLEIISKEDLKLYTKIQAGYILTSVVVDIASVPLAVMALKSSHPVELSAAVLAFNTVAPGIGRAAATLALGKKLNRNFNKMAFFSAIPKVGVYLGVPSQMQSDYGEKEAKVMHYNLRALTALVSKIRPHGGWGSDLEEKIWNSGKNVISKVEKIIPKRYKNTKVV